MKPPYEFQNGSGGQWMRPPSSSFEAMDRSAERINSFLKAVYGWMFAGLGITALVAYAIADSPALIEAIVHNRGLFWVLVIAELGLVFFISARINALSSSTAAGLFLLYS